MNIPKFHLGIAATLAAFFALSPSAKAQLYSEDFEDGSLSPFTVESVPGHTSEIVTPSGFPARDGTKVHRMVWNSAYYASGNLPSKGVQGVSSGAQTKITSEGWYGFSFYAPASFPAPGKAAVLAQLQALPTTEDGKYITCTVGVEVDGRLYLEGAYGIGDGSKTTTAYTILSSSLTKSSWHDVVLYVKFARNNTGSLKVWLDGAPETSPTASFTGINLGNGAWFNDTTLVNGASIKWGPYCWDSANYSPGENREIFFDEIAYQAGPATGAFDLVKPAGYGTGYGLPSPGPIVMAETFDAMTTGAPPTGFTITNGSGTSLNVRDIPSAADKCMQFWDSNSTTRSEATKTFTPQTKRFTATWSFLQNGQGEGHCVALLNGTLSAIELYTIGGNLIYRNSDGSNTILQAVPPNAWYRVDVDVNPVTLQVDVYVNGMRRLTGAAFRRGTTSFDRIRFGTSNASASWHFYINNVSVTQAPVGLAEEFDMMATAVPPTGWTNTGTVAVRDVPTTLDKSVQLGTPSTAVKSETSRAFAPLSGSITASWSFRQTGGTSEGHRMALMAGINTTAVEFVSTAGKLYYVKSGGTQVLVQSISPNAWSNLKIVVNPTTGTATVYVNNVLKLSNQSLRNPVTMVDRVVFSTSDLSPAVSLYIDKVQVLTMVPEMAPLATNVPRLPIVLKLDDLNTGGGNVSNLWRRVTDFLTEHQMKFSAGLIAKSLEVPNNASFVSYVQGLHAGGLAEIWFHGYDHSSGEFGGKPYADQSNRFVTSQSLALTKLGFNFAAFGAPENVFDDTTVQVMSEDPAMNVWLYGDPLRPAGKHVLTRVDNVNIESPVFIPNPEKFVSGYLANYSGRQYFVIQGHPGNWNDARWAEFVRLIDWLRANNFPFKTPAEVAASL